MSDKISIFLLPGVHLSCVKAPFVIISPRLRQGCLSDCNIFGGSSGMAGFFFFVYASCRFSALVQKDDYFTPNIISASNK